MVIDDAHRLPEACCRAVEEYAKDGLLTSTVILLIDTEWSGRQSLSALAKLASKEEFAPLEAAQAGRWVRDYLAQQGKQIDEAALGELLHQHGGESSALRVVLDQLMNWIGERPGIELGDLEAFGWRSRLGEESFGASSKGAFALVEAIGRRNVRSALAVLQEQLAAGKNELELLGLVTWQLQRWVLISRLRESHVPRNQLAAMAGLQSWQLDRVLKELSGRSHAWVRERLRECAELDLAAKSGRVPLMRGALEQLVLTLCLPAAAAQLS
jgi:DNA polymerase-3 subunit delta